MYELFDVLAERRGKSGKQLSGGQQQMLAIGRALMADPSLIIFDEIALGLAPATVDRLYETLVTIRDEGTTMIVIEQNVERGLALADRVFVLEKGTIALAGAPRTCAETLASRRCTWARRRRESFLQKTSGSRRAPWRDPRAKPIPRSYRACAGRRTAHDREEP